MLLNTDLLSSSRDFLSDPDDLYAVLNAHGLQLKTLRFTPVTRGAPEAL